MNGLRTQQKLRETFITKRNAMIKHGPIQQLKNTGISKTHIDPIRRFVVRGIADAKENIELQPLACDVKGAKRHNGQECVIAKCLSRVMHPQAVAVGRSLAYAVFDGLAIRFVVPPASRKLVEEFDQKGRARNAPFSLNAVNPSWRLTKRPVGKRASKPAGTTKRKRMKKFNVRAIGGGVA